MSTIDYGQTAEDHQGLLVLVKHTGQALSQQKFRKVWDRTKKLNSVSIPGQNRNAWVRYKQHYPKENNEWGDFQAHRKVLGLISVGECRTVEEFEDLFDHYKNVKEEYASTLFNSRLIVFGMNRDGTPLEEEMDNPVLSLHSSQDKADSEDSGVTSDISPSDNVAMHEKPLLKETKSDPYGSVSKSSSEGKITFVGKKPLKKTRKQSSACLSVFSHIDTTWNAPLTETSQQQSYQRQHWGRGLVLSQYPRLFRFGGEVEGVYCVIILCVGG